jgi:hypothetical protein
MYCCDASCLFIETGKFTMQSIPTGYVSLHEQGLLSYLQVLKQFWGLGSWGGYKRKGGYGYVRQHPSICAVFSPQNSTKCHCTFRMQVCWACLLENSVAMMQINFLELLPLQKQPVWAWSTCSQLCHKMLPHSVAWST